MKTSIVIIQLCRGLTTCLADMMVQMKIPNETKAIDRYLLAEYLQAKNKARQNQSWCFQPADLTSSLKKRCCQRKQAYLFFRMIIPRIMFAISDPCMEKKAAIRPRVMGKTLNWRWKRFLLIWRSCVTAWRCWSWERSCWSHWLWRTWSPWSHSFWGEKRNTRVCFSIYSTYVSAAAQS